MDDTDRPDDELERFRRQWKEEVRARTRKDPVHNQERPIAKQSTAVVPKSKAIAQSSRLPLAHGTEDTAERSYHDIEEGASGRRVGDDSDHREASVQISIEPRTALEYYEKAAEKEGQGRLGESLADYRKAFKLDAKVHEKYKNKHFPITAPASQTTQAVAPSISDNTTEAMPKAHVLPTHDLLVSFADLVIEAEAPPTGLSPTPPCPIAHIPEEILIDILISVARTNLPSLVRLSQVSKRLAYLIYSEDSIWRHLVHDKQFGIPAMLYAFVCTIEWNVLINEDGFIHGTLANDVLPRETRYPTYRHMFRTRPRIRFNGCYISTVNYTRPGAIGANSLTWNHNVLIVTYYRYLRFFPDGSLISLLTTTEPADVVPYLQKEYVHYQTHGGGHLPQIVMKDALKGRWRLSGNPFSAQASHLGGTQVDKTRTANPNSLEETDQIEPEGDIHIETEGVVSKYKYIMQLRFAGAGQSKTASAPRSGNNKLNWVGYWCHNKLTDDVGEFGLKNDRPYFWSRVRSWQ